MDIIISAFNALLLYYYEMVIFYENRLFNIRRVVNNNLFKLTIK